MTTRTTVSPDLALTPAGCGAQALMGVLLEKSACLGITIADMVSATSIAIQTWMNRLRGLNLRLSIAAACKVGKLRFLSQVRRKPSTNPNLKSYQSQVWPR